MATEKSVRLRYEHVELPHYLKNEKSIETSCFVATRLANDIVAVTFTAKSNRTNKGAAWIAFYKTDSINVDGLQKRRSTLMRIVSIPHSFLHCQIKSIGGPLMSPALPDYDIDYNLKYDVSVGYFDDSEYGIPVIVENPYTINKTFWLDSSVFMAFGHKNFIVSNQMLSCIFCVGISDGDTHYLSFSEPHWLTLSEIGSHYGFANIVVPAGSTTDEFVIVTKKGEIAIHCSFDTTSDAITIMKILDLHYPKDFDNSTQCRAFPTPSFGKCDLHARNIPHEKCVPAELGSIVLIFKCDCEVGATPLNRPFATIDVYTNNIISVGNFDSKVSAKNPICSATQIPDGYRPIVYKCGFPITSKPSLDGRVSFPPVDVSSNVNS